jgi:hypothetical protein
MAKHISASSKAAGAPTGMTAAEVPVTNPHNLATVYANHFGVGATVTDFTLFFMEIGQLPGAEGPIRKNELKAAVTIPMLAIGGLIEALQQVQANHVEQIQALAAAQQKSNNRG